MTHRWLPRWLVIGFFAVGLIPAAQARGGGVDDRLEREAARAASLLAGESFVDRAWGAYLAGRGGFESLVPAVIRLVEAANEQKPGPSDAIRNAALDALIRLDADVSSDVLMGRLSPRTLVPTVILLAKHPARNRDALLRLVDREPMDGAHRWGAARVLAPLRPDGLGGRLLAELRFRIDVMVHDEGTAPPGIGFGGRGGGSSRMGRHLPPFAHYTLLDTPMRGCLVVTRHGRPALYAKRTEYGGHFLTMIDRTSEAERTRLALVSIAVLLGKDPAALAEHARTEFYVPWSSASALRSKVEDAKRDLGEIRRSLVRELRDAALLDRPDPPEDARVEIVVHDARSRKEPALPALR